MKTGAWSVTADRMVSFDSPARTVADGNVSMEYFKGPGNEPVTIKANSVTFYPADSMIRARGNVVINDAASKVSASEASIDLNNQTGTLKDSRVVMAGQTLHFSGRLIEKTGPETFRLTDSLITACPVEGDKSPAWSIRCSEAKITIDGLAYLKHSSLRAKKLPVLYTPFMVLPAKITRATGFLFPEISHSNRNGTGLVTPYFINLSPSSDITLYPGYYSERGTMTGIDIRHMYDVDSMFALGGSYLGDRVQDTGAPFSDGDYRKDGYLRTRKDRYWLRGMADHSFSDRTVLKIDVDFVSDQDYLHEFRESVSGFDKTNSEMKALFNRSLQEASLDFRESIIHFSSRGEQTSGGVELRYSDDALSDYSSTSPAHTLPRIIFNSRLPLSGMPFSFDWNSEYINYYRKEGLGYQRFDMIPRLVAPVPLGKYVEGTFSTGFHETIYQIETYGDSGASAGTSPANINRNGLEVAANVATVLVRDFKTGGAKLKNLQHTFRPNLKYNYLYTDDQSELPDLDSRDRILLGNNLTLQLNNYFLVTSTDEKGDDHSRNLGSIKLSQSYNIREERRETTGTNDKRRPFSDLAFDIETYPLANLYLHYYTTLNVYGNGITAYKLSSRYSNSRNDSFTIDYNYSRGSASDLTTTAQIKLHRLLSASYSTSRSFMTDHKNNESIGLIYTPQCWTLEIAATENTEDKKIMLTLSLTGIGKAWEWDQSNL